MTNFPLRYGALAVAIAAFGLFAPMALAQTSTQNNSPAAVDPNEGFSSPDGELGPLDSPTGAFDLIHQSVLRNNTSPQEFQMRQRDRLSNEAASFRELQQQRIREIQAAESAEPAE